MKAVKLNQGEISKYQDGEIMLRSEFQELIDSKVPPQGFKWWCSPTERGSFRKILVRLKRKK